MKGSRMVLLGIASAVVLCGLLVWLSHSRAGSNGEEPLMLYCAAGVKPPVTELVELFETRYGVKVQLQYGGSGSLLSNLTVYRRGDLYIAADESYMDQAREKGLVEEVFALAYQTPVIAVQKGNPENIKTLDDLLRPNLRLALGNPDVASIGRQTRNRLEKAGIWEKVLARVEKSGVFKPAVPEVANDVKLGAVDAGVVWDATVAQYPELEAVPVSIFDEAKEEIGIALLGSSRQRSNALRLAHFLQSEVGKEVFRRCGYSTKEAVRWRPVKSMETNGVR